LRGIKNNPVKHKAFPRSANQTSQAGNSLPERFNLMMAIRHYRQADDLRRGPEVANELGVFIPERYDRPMKQRRLLNQSQAA
jgi:hypothetical protein